MHIWHLLHCLQRMDLAPGAPLAPDAPRQLPLVIFSHGLGGNRFLCAAGERALNWLWTRCCAGWLFVQLAIFSNCLRARAASCAPISHSYSSMPGLALPRPSGVRTCWVALLPTPFLQCDKRLAPPPACRYSIICSELASQVGAAVCRCLPAAPDAASEASRVARGQMFCAPVQCALASRGDATGPTAVAGLSCRATWCSRWSTTTAPHPPCACPAASGGCTADWVTRRRRYVCMFQRLYTCTFM